MRPALIPWVLLALLGSAQASAEPIFKPGARLAMCGDSITDQTLYTRDIEMYLAAYMPQLPLVAMQFAWSGDRAASFDSRFQHVMMPFQPTVVTTCYGMNDGGYKPYTPAIGQTYEAPMRGLVTKLKAAGVTVVVGGPGAVDPTYFRSASASGQVYNDSLSQLSETARKSRRRMGCLSPTHTTP